MRVEEVFGHKLVKVAKHRATVHVVAIEQVVGVREIGAVAGREVDGAREAVFLVDVVRGVVHLVGALHDGVVDVGVVDRDPAAIVAVYGRKLARGEARRWVVDDGRAILELVPARLGRLRDVEAVIHRKAAENQENRSQKACDKADCVARVALDSIEDLYGRARTHAAA